MKNFFKIIAAVNALPIDENSPLLETRRKREHFGSHEQVPDYIRSPSIQKALGATVLSLFGGADVTALKNPSVTSLLIVDASPFVSTAAFTQKCSPNEADGLFHQGLGLFVLAYSPFLYSTMDNHSDYDSPFSLMEEGNGGLLNDYEYRENLNIPRDDITFNFINANFTAINSNNLIVLRSRLGLGESEELKPVVSKDEIGLSTLILLRIRYCLQADILEIEELVDGKFFHIKIKRRDDSEASLYYASCYFGGNSEDKALLYFVSTHIKNELGGISSILVRGYPPFFSGQIKGEKNRVGHEVRTFVTNSMTTSINELQCVVCTNGGDVLPDFFIGDNKHLSKYQFSNKAPGKTEVVYIGDGTCLMDNSVPKQKNELYDARPNSIFETGKTIAQGVTQVTDVSFATQKSNPDVRNYTNDIWSIFRLPDSSKPIDDFEQDIDINEGAAPHC